MQAFIAISLGLCELRIPIWLREASLQFSSAIFHSSLNLVRPSSVWRISITQGQTALESAARAASIHIYIVGHASKLLLARIKYIHILLCRTSVKTSLNLRAATE